ncbi:MAG: aminotransferase class I/II-fold pyridoxal phosphate-dependent enzyme [Bacteroidota bacterium]|nr:aminotransferase class I/II-fold pyridoxal phosphate-dependent enzyme [Bacteroidota bacterium]
MNNQHGDDYQGVLKANFSSNVWYGADNTGLHDHLSALLIKTCRYPEIEAESLKAVLAEKCRMTTSCFSTGNGSIDIIYRIAQANHGKKSIIVSPTFSEYSKACEVNGHEIKRCYREDLLIEIDKFQPDLVWICNPNNPDGYCYNKNELQVAFYTYPQVTFIVDQSFADFTLQETLAATAICEFPNLILLYSLTKRHTIPGLRIGYVTASEPMIRQLDKYKIPWSVNTLALEAGKYILTRKDSSFDLKGWLTETFRFQQEINRIGVFETLPTQTPFFLVKLLKGTAVDLKDFLLKGGILIRDATGFENNGTEMIRLNTLSIDQNNLLIDKLRTWKQDLLL